MCLIVFKPEGEKLDWELLKKGYQVNDDGCGYIVAGNTPEGKRRTTYGKGMWTWEGLKKWIGGFDSHKVELAIHFRMATHGTVDANNCHPFPGNAWVMMHNGIIQGFGSQTKSDTAEFAELLADTYGPAAPYKADEWENMTGWSRFLFATPEEMVIVNQNAGVWKNGIWYSNDNSWSPMRSYYYMGGGSCAK